MREFRVENSADFKVGQEIKADIFNVGDKVDVTGISKGKGFAGPMKNMVLVEDQKLTVLDTIVVRVL